LHAAAVKHNYFGSANGESALVFASVRRDLKERKKGKGEKIRKLRRERARERNRAAIFHAATPLLQQHCSMRDCDCDCSVRHVGMANDEACIVELIHSSLFRNRDA